MNIDCRKPSFRIMWGHAVSLNLNVFSFLQKLFPWVGLRKINVSYWGWEDNSPFTNTSLQWLPGEPNDSGFCAYLERAQVSGLRANPCNANTDGLICEKAVGKALVTVFIFPASVQPRWEEEMFCFLELIAKVNKSVKQRTTDKCLIYRVLFLVTYCTSVQIKFSPVV